MSDKKEESVDKFKTGDWIIATKSLLGASDMFSFGLGGTKRDDAYMHKPIKISAITETHVVIETSTIGGDKRNFIIPMEEVNNRGFVVADKILVDTLCKN